MDVEALCVYFGLAVYVVCWVFGFWFGMVSGGRWVYTNPNGV
jgi:hypothetical protein